MKVIVENSSSIKSFEYDNSDLVVEFNGGSKYIYKDVDAGVVEAFSTSESKGKFFAANIKDKFLTEKLDLAPVVPDERLGNANLDEILEWTEEEEQAFLEVLNKKK